MASGDPKHGGNLLSAKAWRKTWMSPPRDRARDRRAHLGRTFDAQVQREWRRYSVEPSRILRRELRERFLRRHLRGARGPVLELGPGPGRFTPTILESARGTVLDVDLSPEGLKASRRRHRARKDASRLRWVRGAGEHLPVPDRSMGAEVVLGNIICFAAEDGPGLLRELARVMRRGGQLIVDFASPAGATSEFFVVASQRRLLPRILRDPEYYLLNSVLGTGYQPYAPARMARWEFQFYTVNEAHALLESVGFQPVDTMTVAPLAAFQDRVAAIARRDRRTWETLLRTEERIGRRPGTFETGHGFLVAAVRR